MFPHAENTEAVLQSALTYATRYIQNLDNFPVSRTETQPLEVQLPENGWGTEGVIEYFQQHCEQYLVASSGARYWGFVTGGTTPAAIAGDWLTSVFDQNTQNLKGNGDVSAVIEDATIKLLLDLFELPKNDFAGGFVTGATMSNFTCLAVARQWLGKQLGKNIALDGVSESLKILTATPHSSAVKSLSMLGLGSKNFIKIKTPADRESIDNQDLVQQIESLNGQPFILITSGGTVNTVDFDDMKFIAELKKKHNFWWHIDAAFGGFVAFTEPASSADRGYRHLVEGWELADSICIDGHKWLNVPYDSAFFFTRKEHAPLQVETFQNANAPYLGNPFDNFSYLNFGPENSRRFRALPTFFTLLAYGKEGYKKIVNDNIYHAQRFGQLLIETNKFVLTAPVRVNVVCFTIKNKENDKKAIDDLLSALAKDGKVFVTPTFYNNQWCIRAAFVNWRTTEQDLDVAVKSFKKALESLH